jgi:hypothetical protein
MAAAAPTILSPEMVWDSSTMTTEKIQSLVKRGLLRPKAELEWKAPTGQRFATEDDKEQVIFASFFEHMFSIPAIDFFRCLLYLLTVQNRAQVHRKPTSDLVPFSPRRVLPRFVNPRIGSKLLRLSI